MGESFVDVSYRGLDLGRRLKLREVRSETGYLEIPLPMPVGTRVEIAVDDVRFEALVTQIHEQVGGSDQVPGMRVKPTLQGAAMGWWGERVDRSLPAEPVASAVMLPPAAVAVATPVATVAASVAAASVVAAEPEKAAPPEPERPAIASKPTLVMSAEMVRAALLAADVAPYVPAVDDGKPTQAMAAIDPDTMDTVPEVPVVPPSLVVDDGRRTTVMDAIDISMITGRANSEIGMAAVEDDDTEISIEPEEDGGNGNGEVSGEIATTPSGKVSTGNGRAKRNTSPPAKKRGTRKKR